MLNTPDRHLLAALVDSSDDGIVSKTLAGVITSWNAAATRIFGYTAEEAVGSHISILFPVDRLAEEDHLLGEIGAGRRVEHFETVRLRKDGTPIQVSVSLSPIRSVEGVIVGASKIVRDITARKESEEALRKSEEAHRLVVSLNDAIRHLREPEDILSELVMRVGRRFGVSRCTFGEIDAAQEYVTTTSDFADGADALPARYPLADLGDLVADLRFGRTVVVSDVATDPTDEPGRRHGQRRDLRHARVGVGAAGQERPLHVVVRAASFRAARVGRRRRPTD